MVSTSSRRWRAQNGTKLHRYTSKSRPRYERNPPPAQAGFAFYGMVATNEPSGRWAFLAHFQLPAPMAGQAWESLQPFVEIANDFAATTARAVQVALDAWDVRLETLGGDALRKDWSRFRPLRLSREEDWADWLAHLLETSERGHFAAHVFGRSSLNDVEVSREIVALGSADQDRRLDLMLKWSDGDYSSLEIKIGDQSFAKTREAARFIQNQRSGSWQHCLLVPPDDEERAADAVSSDDDQLTITVLT